MIAIHCLLGKNWMRGLFDRVLPARSWEMPVERELAAKLRRRSKKPGGQNFDFGAKSSCENSFDICKKFSQDDFTLKSKL